MSEESKAGFVSGDKLHELTGLTDRRHRQLADLGDFPAPVRGQYEFKRTLQGLFRYYQEGTGDKKKETSAEKLRKLTAQADEIALRNEEARKRLVDRVDFLKRLEPIYTEVRQKILACSMP